MEVELVVEVVEEVVVEREEEEDMEGLEGEGSGPQDGVKDQWVLRVEEVEEVEEVVIMVVSILLPDLEARVTLRRIL